ncbi:MAG: hypothetical protein IKS40_00180 [Treponema sp.]|nr:hypothetical protein [Treponema sp.]
MAKYQFKRIISVFLLITGMSLSSHLFAQDMHSLVQIYADIDKAFASRSGEAVSAVLKTNSDSPSYELVENYTLKKTRQLIIRNDLEFAKETSLALIDNNVENYDAIDLYSYIDKALVGEEQKKQAAEEKRQREQARLAALSEKTRQQIQQRGSYQTMNTTSGKAVYVSEQEQSYSPLLWAVKLGIANVMYQMVTEPDNYNSLKYGLSVGLDMFYPTENFVFGLEGLVNVHFLSLTGEQEFMISGSLIPKIAYSGINKHLFLRAGFAAYPTLSDDKETVRSISSFYTPAIGLGFENIDIGASKFGIHGDYYPGHFAHDDLKAAAEFGASILLPLNVHERTKVGIELGAGDVLFIKEEGIENRIKGIFAIGVGNVQK